MLEHDKPKLKYGFVPWYVFKTFRYIRFLVLFFFSFKNVIFAVSLKINKVCSSKCIFLCFTPLIFAAFFSLIFFIGLGTTCALRRKKNSPKTLNMRANVDCESHTYTFSCSSIADTVGWNRREFNLFKVKLTASYRWNKFDVDIVLNDEIF